MQRDWSGARCGPEIGGGAKEEDGGGAADGSGEANVGNELDEVQCRHGRGVRCDVGSNETWAVGIVWVADEKEGGGTVRDGMDKWCKKKMKMGRCGFGGAGE